MSGQVLCVDGGYVGGTPPASVATAQLARYAGATTFIREAGKRGPNLAMRFRLRRIGDLYCGEPGLVGDGRPHDHLHHGRRYETIGASAVEGRDVQ